MNELYDYGESQPLMYGDNLCYMQELYFEKSISCSQRHIKQARIWEALF